jgi:asparagine synthase (glutamine-hydrolysing)
MCGICGFVANGAGNALGREHLQRMTDALIHRGPDEEGMYLQDRIGLGCRRLSIIDVAGGHQPIANEDGTIRVVLNGELFNYRELRAVLVSRGHRFATASDTEVIVHLYEEAGAECIARLRGMFAFAVWDSRRGILLLGRDRLGIKPLYYTEQGGRLVFASEIKSLLAALPGSRELNPHAVDDYMSLGYIPGAHTVFASIHRLPPAHVLQWQDGHSRLHQYWTLEYAVTPPPMREATERLRALLEDAVRAWMISDVPVGAFLSGGVDSSTVTALMCRVSNTRVKTFSIGFAEPDYDELRYARQIAARYDTDHHELVVDADQAALLPELVWYLDEPFADDSAIPTFLVSRLARASVKVALSGDGGDELFGGYTWTTRDQFRRWYGWVPRPLRHLLEHAVLNGEVPPYARGWLDRLRRGLRDAASSMEDGYLRRITVARQFKDTLYTPDFRASLGRYDGVATVRALLEAAEVKDARERMLYVDQRLYLPDDILFKVDRMSMANSLEARTPLLDHPLVEFAAALPYDLKVRGLTSKYLLKRAVRDLLPPPLLRQRKQGFSMPVGRWLRGDLGTTARALLLGHDAERRGLWNPDFVRWMLDEHQAGRHDFGRRLWSLLVFEVWARLYLDGVPARTPPEALTDLV